jgi:magnesium chelatase family protein
VPPSLAFVLARVLSFAIDGLDSRPVLVEVDLRPGLPAFTIVGLGDLAVRESRERVRAGLLNSGFEFPLRRVTVNLAPAHLRKAGPGFDLAIACGVLAASGQVPAEPLEHVAVYGELALGGELRACRGTLAVAEGTSRAGLRGLVVPQDRVHEAALVPGLEILGAATLTSVADLLRGGEPPAPPPEPGEPVRSAPAAVDLADVRGHHEPLEAITVAAAGGHNLLMSGPPGTGKTMLARRLPTILPPLSRAEAIEVTRIHSVAGLHGGRGLIERRPFRAPHHTISPSGLVGGGTIPSPGEVTLAHHGVLFLDEVSEFPRSSLEALRQPLEDGRLTIVRGQRTAVFPSRIMLVASTNPCPCGFAGTRRCRCGEAEIERHRRKLSGPLLDRLDLLVHVERPTGRDLRSPAVRTSAVTLGQVLAARERQAARLAGTGAACNAHMDAGLIRAHVKLESAAERRLRGVYERGQTSPRGHQRILRVAQTVADLSGSDRVTDEHVLKAVFMRQDHETRAAERAA